MVKHLSFIFALSLPLLTGACAVSFATPQPPAVATPAPSLAPTLSAVISPPPPPTAVPVATATPTPTVVATGVPSPTPSTPVPPTRPAPATPGATPTSGSLACAVLPMGSFRSIWQSDKNLQAALGCPNSSHPRITPTAWQVKTSYQPFERGVMIWTDHIGWYAQPTVFVLYLDSTYQSFQDSFSPSLDTVSSNATPPAGLVGPILGFGKVWLEQPGLRDRIGWGKASETSGIGRFEMLTGGYMVWISQTNRTYVLIFHENSNAVRIFDVPFSEN